MMTENSTPDTNASTWEANDPSIPNLVCGVIMITVTCIGVLGNIMTAIVFGLPKLSSPNSHPGTCNSSVIGSKKTSATINANVKKSSSGWRLSSISILVTGLSVADAILLSVSCPLFASSALMNYSPTLPMMNAVSYMIAYAYPLAMMCQTMSVWTLSVITIERWTAVKYPFLARIVCTPSRAIAALILIFVFSAGYNACRFWEYEILRIVASDDPNAVLVLAIPTLRKRELYMRIYGHWMYFVFIFAVPFSVLAGFNGSVVRCVRMARKTRQELSRQQTKEQGTAVMMVLVALVFLACNLLAFLLNALEVFGVSGAQKMQVPGGDDSSGGETIKHSGVFYILVDFNNLLIMTHCSMNFFIYYNFSQRFRLGFYRVWSRCAWFRLCCHRKIRKAYAAAVVNGTHHENTETIRIPQLRRWSSNSARSSAASFDAGQDSAASRLYLQEVKAGKSTPL